MPYFIYKLKFPKGIHIGDSSSIGLEKTSMEIKSDTFFSALYMEYISIYNDKDFYKISENSEFLLSDLFPYFKDNLFIPKPFVSIQRKVEPKNEQRNQDRKKVKKLNYLKASESKKFIEFLKTGENFPENDFDFGTTNLHTKNKINIDEDNLLYNIESYGFNEESGLYFLVKIPEEFIERFDIIIESLGYTAIGGKRSAGFGQFEVKEKIDLSSSNYPDEDSAYFAKNLEKESSVYFNMSTYIPKQAEISKLKEEKNYYQLIKRSGFVNRASYSKNPQKRKQIYAVSSGSVFSFKPEGEIKNLKLHGEHNIYRFGKPMLLGVDQWEI